MGRGRARPWVEAMGVALGAVGARDAGELFAACGYRTPAQQL